MPEPQEPALRSHFIVAIVAYAVVAALGPEAARAQSITAGAVSGTVRDSMARPLADVRVELMDRTSGFARALTTGRDGRFAFAFLAPGEYDLLAEQLGYRPVEVRGLRVRPSAEVDIQVRLEAAEPPVMERTITVQDPVTLSGGEIGPAWTLSTFALRRLADEERDLGAVGRFTTTADESLVVEGLPADMTQVSIDGIPFRMARHPIPGAFSAPTRAFPLTSVSEVTVAPGGLDVEWSDFTAGRVDALGRRGSAGFEASLFGDWTSPDLTRSKYYTPGDLSGNSFRGGVTAGGPVIPDTAHFLLGIEGQRLQVPVPPAWEATGIDSALLAIAADSFGVDLGSRLTGRLADIKSVSGFGRFDWQASERNRLSVFGFGAALEAVDPPAGVGLVPSTGTTLDGIDIAAAVTLTSALSRAFALELRAGFETSRREYLASDTALTLGVIGPFAFGTDPAFSGRFEVTRFRAVETVHLQLGSHRVKLGAGGTITSHDQTYAFDRGGTFAFGGLDQFGTRTGAFRQTVGRTPVAKFTTQQFGGFIQDRWSAAPGFDFLLGLRFDWDRLPQDKILSNDAWLALTGVRNDSVVRSAVKLSPRVGFTWDVSNRHRWVVRAEGSVYHGMRAPEAFAEAVATGRGLEARSGVGVLSRWPTPPDSTSAPVDGPTFAIVHPDLRAPRTARGLFAIAGSVGGGAVVHLSASFRHTDYLVRRHDLNLLPAPTGRDQYGRPVYGILEQSGSAVFVQPGTNRRFDEFGTVTALDQDGYSQYVGFTARLEKQVGRVLRFSTGYTYSQTDDNWFGARGGPDGRLSPFPDSVAGVDWADGTSDFDVPHRFVFGAEVGLRVVTLGALYTFRSGYPFTPGFRDGVDANGDGSWRNDPAFVDDQLAGVSDLFPEWPCLLAQVGRFAERNACRGPAIQRLDLRLGMGPFKLGYPVEIVLDALNLLDAGYLEVDRALYLVDPTSGVTTDPGTRTVTVPLLANPDFGRAIRRYGSGRVFRIGIRVNYE